MPEVELVDISKSFGKVKAIDHLNLRVKDGEYFTLIGPTGHGKTTTLKLIAGLLKPDEGEVLIDGRNVTDLPPEDRGVGFVFETFALFPHYDVWRNVTFGPRVRGEQIGESNRVARRLLEMVLLERRATAYPDELSGGMKQRVALVRALATGSGLLLLDEPFGSLDAKTRMILRNEVRTMVEHLGLTAIHVTNNTEEAMTISDRIGVLKKGCIIQVDAPEELYKHPQSLFAANFLGESNFFEGKVKEVTEDGLLVETESRRTLKMTTSYKWEKEDRVVLAVRAENVDIAQSKSRRANALDGTVERSQFVLGFVRYEIRLEAGGGVVAWTTTMQGRSLKIGSKVTVSFKPETVLAFRYPDEGLEKAITFE